jgi:CheY-like chemotaxis protein
LLVEDDAEVRQVTAGFLRSLACVVLPCQNAEEALAELAGAGGAFDLLLSDVALGSGLRGTELAQRVNQQWPAIAVVLMSGYSQELSGASPASAGEAAAGRPWRFLPKPFTRAELATAMGLAIGQKTRP